MHWVEEGVVVNTRGHGETSAIVELFTRAHGRHLGIVRGGRSRRLRPVLQPGNIVHASWRARLSEHLGNFAVEPVSLRAAGLIDDPLRLTGLMTLTRLVQLLPEREPHQRLYDSFLVVLDAFEDDAVWPALLVRWELGLLDELGFGLDLSRCAASGTTDDLAYVSPRSGRAVSRPAGEAYADRLLALPAFLLGKPAATVTIQDILAGFRLTGFFLDRYVWQPRGLAAPELRQRLIERLQRSGATADTPDAVPDGSINRGDRRAGS